MGMDGGQGRLPEDASGMDLFDSAITRYRCFRDPREGFTGPSFLCRTAEGGRSSLRTLACDGVNGPPEPRQETDRLVLRESSPTARQVSAEGAHQRREEQADHEAEKKQAHRASSGERPQ